jgi:hypothetical protein
MLYLLPKICAFALAAIYALVTDARDRNKVLVILCVGVSFVLQRQGAFTAAWVAGLVIQVGVSIYVLLYLKMQD